MVSRWVFADEGSEQQTADSDEDLELGGDDAAVDAGRAALDHLNGDLALNVSDAGPSTIRRQTERISIKLSGTQSDICHVCGSKGHFAGFVGATYIDCVNKPCYLCGQQGHSTGACPHRIAPELACVAAADASRGSIIHELQHRERAGAASMQRSLPPRPGNWLVDAAVLKLHARRTTCLEFHPTLDNIVLSGDKHGQIAVWDVVKVFERTVYPDINRWLTNAIRFLPGSSDTCCATASYDGTVKLFDVEIGVPVRTLVDANPCGWENVVQADKSGTWVTFIGLDVSPSMNVVVAGDSKGKVYFLDPRVSDAPVSILGAHKKNTKVQSVSTHPIDGCLVLTAGNDYHARLLDARCLGGSQSAPAPMDAKGKAPVAADKTCIAAEVGSLVHPRVINAASFSPMTGRKIVTTCQDNRLRVWDDWTTSLGGVPDREIVHSHTFNRHLTAFRSEFDPKDPTERLVAIGRYISEDFGGIALHPVDLIDSATGATVGQLADPNLTTICPVNKPHPRIDLLVTGSSRSLYAWRPMPGDDDQEEAGRSSREGALDGGGGSSLPLPGGSRNFVFFDADGSGKNKKRRAKVTTPKSGTKKQQQQQGGGTKGGSDSEGSDS